MSAIVRPAPPPGAGLAPAAVGTYHPRGAPPRGPERTLRDACGCCGRPVAPLALWRARCDAGPGPGPARLCSAFCLHRLSALPPWQRCGVCGRAIGEREWVTGCCADPACRAEGLVDRPARARAAELASATAAAAAAAAAARDAALAGSGSVPEGADEVPAVLVPGPDRRAFPLTAGPRDRALAPLPRRRRRALAAHVRAQAAAAAASAPNAAAPAATAAGLPLGAELLGAACAACRGRCCRAGGDRAYLDAAALARFLAAHPGARPRDAAAAYAARLPARTVRGSCAFHGPDGCGLPRAMRADVCNRYECGGLAELRAHLARRAAAGQPPGAAYVAVVSVGHDGGAVEVTRGALIGTPAGAAPAGAAPAGPHSSSSCSPTSSTSSTSGSPLAPRSGDTA